MNVSPFETFVVSAAASAKPDNVSPAPSKRWAEAPLAFHLVDSFWLRLRRPYHAAVSERRVRRSGARAGGPGGQLRRVP